MLGVSGARGLGNGPVVRPSQLQIVEKGGGGDREAHAAQLRHDTVAALEGLRAQPAAEPAGLVDHGPEAELHELEGGDEAGEAGADDRDLGPVPLGGQAAQAGRVADPVVEGEGKIRAEGGDGPHPAVGAGDRLVRGGHGDAFPRSEASASGP